MSDVTSAAPAATSPATTQAVTDSATTNTQAQSSDQAKLQNLQSQPQTEQVKQEIKDLKKRLQIKVHGKDREVELDLGDEKVLKQLAEKAFGADEVFQKSAMTEKQMKQLQDAIKDKGKMWDVLREHGHDVDEEIMGYMERQIEEQKKSPQQKEFERIQKELETERAEKQRLMEEKTRIENERISNEYANKINQEIDEAFKTDLKGLPKSAYTIKRMAAVAQAFLDKGYQIPMTKALEIVQTETQNELREAFNSMDPDALEEFLGEEINKRMRQRRIERAKAKKTQTASQIQPTGVKELEQQLEADKNKPKPAAKDWFNSLGKR